MRQDKENATSGIFDGAQRETRRGKAPTEYRQKGRRNGREREKTYPKTPRAPRAASVNLR